MKIKLESQSLLRVGDKFSLFNDDEPTFRIVGASKKGAGFFSVKRLPNGKVDHDQQIPHPSGDFPCWVWR